MVCLWHAQQISEIQTKMELQYIYDNRGGSSHCIAAQYNSPSSKSEANYHFLRNLWAPKVSNTMLMTRVSVPQRASHPTNTPVHACSESISEARDSEDDRRSAVDTAKSDISFMWRIICVVGHPKLSVVMLEAWN